MEQQAALTGFSTCLGPSSSRKIKTVRRMTKEVELYTFGTHKTAACIKVYIYVLPYSSVLVVAFCLLNANARIWERERD